METQLTRVLEFRIPADTRYLALVRRGVRDLAESAGFTKDVISDVEVAVSEAITNSVEHGSPDAEAAEVTVKCEARFDCMVVEIEDQSTARCLPTDIESDYACERGRGVAIMRILMDECEDFRTERGIRVRMAKQKV